MDFKLNKEDVIKIIGLYRSYPLLWDMQDNAYRRNDLKNKAYESIAKAMKLTAEVVKKKIRILRSTYTNVKRKMSAQKSGSGLEDRVTSSLAWFEEMRFLDNSINLRKRMDNSNEYDTDAIEDTETGTYIEEETPRKRPRCMPESPSDKIDDAIAKILKQKDNQFSAFGASIAQQLESMPEELAIELMGDLQNRLTQRRLEYFRQNKFRPISSSSIDIRTSTPSSDILNQALNYAEINFEQDE